MFETQQGTALDAALDAAADRHADATAALRAGDADLAWSALDQLREALDAADRALGRVA